MSSKNPLSNEAAKLNENSPEECPHVDELVEFVNGRVSRARLAFIESHLDSCAACGEKLADLPGDELVQRLSKIEFVEGLVGPRTSQDPFALSEDSRYELLAKLGEGGMGEVFKAKHKVMKRTVALKTIRADLINHPEAVKRFAKESRAAARLSHPNIVTAFDAEREGDFHILVMEFVDGESLSKIVNAQGPMAVETAVGIACQAAEGLQHAHERNMVHRDIKPQNLMIDQENVVKILDFGLSKFRRDLESDETDSVSEETVLTLNNTSLGTEGFIAPEQAEDARSVDTRSDVYSLGCTLFFMLTNRPPYFGRPPGEDCAVPDVTRFRKDLPPGLLPVLAKMMASNPDDRYSNPQEALDALKAIDLTETPLPVSKSSPVKAESVALSNVDDRPYSQPIWPIVVGVIILLITAIFLLIR